MFPSIRLKHSAESKYEPELYEEFQLVDRKNAIDALGSMIRVSNTRLFLLAFSTDFSVEALRTRAEEVPPTLCSGVLRPLVKR
jgi:hypothetical protein